MKITSRVLRDEWFNVALFQLKWCCSYVSIPRRISTWLAPALAGDPVQRSARACRWECSCVPGPRRSLPGSRTVRAGAEFGQADRGGVAPTLIRLGPIPFK